MVKHIALEAKCTKAITRHIAPVAIIKHNIVAIQQVAKHIALTMVILVKHIKVNKEIAERTKPIMVTLVKHIKVNKQITKRTKLIMVILIITHIEVDRRRFGVNIVKSRANTAQELEHIQYGELGRHIERFLLSYLNMSIIKVLHSEAGWLGIQQGCQQTWEHRKGFEVDNRIEPG